MNFWGRKVNIVDRVLRGFSAPKQDMSYNYKVSPKHSLLLSRIRVCLPGIHWMKTTLYFFHMRKRDDRSSIQLEWIQTVMNHPEYEKIQPDGRIRRWGKVSEMKGRYLRVILLSDDETIHNAFFDRSFKP